MPTPRRIEKVRVLLREVLADILERDVVPPPGAMITITRVEVSDDFYYATVYFSVLGEGADEVAVKSQLAEQTGDIQHSLNRKLRMRPVPKITFAVDQDEKRRERIEKLLGEHPAEN